MGTIENASGDELGLNQPSYHHSATLNYVKQLEQDDSNKGIFLYLNTGGGGVYESDELYLALMEYKEVTGRPIWAYFGPTTASGGYYIAMAADHIIANRNTTTGSIGVILSYTDVSGLYEKLGLKTVYITSGPNKSMGASDLPLTDEQRAIYQSVVDEAYDQFVGIVCEGRGMEDTRVRQLADGRIYTAQQALDNGLIDEIGEYEQALADFSDLTGADPYYTDFSEQTIFSWLLGAVETVLPKSDNQVLEELAETAENGVPMYVYAG
ncbi:MAG TPA: signal peptide peptidase SppA [Candidatus Pygmaiobacter gallistercoris]|nr:signal peptide peptidase SppA [Candidatus Pygmaiobacter gallistercoris]